MPVPKASSRASSSRSAPSEIPFARRRLLPEQIMALQALFEAKTHPSKEERALLAAELGLEVKSVNVWYQNKRRNVKKKALIWSKRSSKENRHTDGRDATSRRALETPLLAGSLSLDCIATSRERRDSPLRPARPPLTPRRHHPPRRHGMSPETGNLWEHIPSSPLAPPSSPSADSIRLGSLPLHAKPLKSLEWACANARAKQKSRNTSEVDVPPLELDRPMDVDGDETETESHEAITPDASMRDVLLDFSTPTKGFGRSPRSTGEVGKNDGPGPMLPAKDMEAAMALLGFKAPRL